MTIRTNILYRVIVPKYQEINSRLGICNVVMNKYIYSVCILSLSAIYTFENKYRDLYFFEERCYCEF